MKISAVVAAIVPFLAADKKPEDVLAAVLAADKKAKDEFPDKAAKDKAAKDRKSAHDKARDSMSEDEKKAFDAMSDEEKDKAAKDKADNDAEDADVDAEDDLAAPESGTPAKTGANKAPAMDSAEVDRRIAAAVAARDELHTATREVEPIVGKRTFDSAGDAYKAGLEALHVDLTGIPASAYRAVLTLARDRAAPAPIAMDSESVAEVAKLIPNYNRL